MEITVNGIGLYYERFDAAAPYTVLLHGWGASIETMRGIFNFLAARGKSVVMVDLPYFGKSAPPPPHYGIYEYAETAAEFIHALSLGGVNLLGHSFGGRIAAILAAKHRIGKKLIFTGAAGVKPKRSLPYYCKVLAYKLKKRFGKVSQHAGSADYRALPDTMKPVFVRVVNTHLNKLYPKITAPSLLIWGSRDRDTPLYMAKKMRRKIPDSGLVVLQDAGHYSFLDQPYQFYAVIESFLQA
ncbi:MAG: alpha/beta hydrolase [Firmicutes bacterium]|nr:alpha/beta hydrolase [Bacillota bacterium]